MAIRELNLELGYPTVDEAIRRLSADAYYCLRAGKPMKLIHGYGSSGKGGKIRTECRKWLQDTYGSEAIVIYGENFSIFDEATRKAFLSCPELRNDRDLEAFNRGVTFLIWNEK